MEKEELLGIIEDGYSEERTELYLAREQLTSLPPSLRLISSLALRQISAPGIAIMLEEICPNRQG